MKLLLDVNLSPRWTEFLAQAGFEVYHWSTIGPSNAPDTQIMAFAAKDDYVVITHDLDFSAILAATHGQKPSVVQIRAARPKPELIGSQVIAALKQMKVELKEGALITIDTNRTWGSPHLNDSGARD